MGKISNLVSDVVNGAFAAVDTALQGAGDIAQGAVDSYNAWVDQTAKDIEKAVIENGGSAEDAKLVADKFKREATDEAL